MSTIVLWEISKKQNYIFKGNKLKESIGASFIVKKLTEDFEGYGLKEDGFVIKGGGSTLYIFDSSDLADEFIESYSLDVAKTYPGIELFMVKEQIDFQRDDIKSAIKNAYTRLEKKKSMREGYFCQAGFGIERDCESTGLPASTSYNEDGTIKYISREADIKRDIAKRNQSNYFNDLLPSGYGFPIDIEKIVLENEKNYISVVHIDGNSMGKKLRSIEKNINKRADESQYEFNKRYVSALKSFSNTTEEAYKNAFKAMVKRLAEYVDEREKSEGEKIIPVRPLIMAGDDVTFICNSYVSVEASRIFLEELGKRSLRIGEVDLGGFYACAGISTVKKGYPFSKAYAMAEELCQISKSLLLEKGYENTSALDFHISQGDINKSITEIRKDEYIAKDGMNLTFKPFILDKNQSWKNYYNFLEALENIHVSIKKDLIPRSKVKELRDVFKNGFEATKLYFKFYKINPEQTLRTLSGTNGEFCFNRYDNTCMYLDAIEAMDIFSRL